MENAVTPAAWNPGSTDPWTLAEFKSLKWVNNWQMNIDTKISRFISLKILWSIIALVECQKTLVLSYP